MSQSKYAQTFAPLLLIFKELRPHWARVALTLAGLIASATLVLTFGLGLRLFIDAGLQDGGGKYLNQTILGLMGLSLLLAVAAYIRTLSTAFLAEHVVAQIKKSFFAHLLRLDAPFYDTQKTGDLLARLSVDTTYIRTLISGSLAVALRSLIQLIGAIIFMCFTSLTLALATLVTIPMALLPMAFWGARVKQTSAASQAAQGDLHAFAEERLSAIQTVHAFGQESHTTDTFNDLLQTACALSETRMRARSMTVAIVIAAVFISISIVLWLGGRFVISGQMTPGALSAFIFYAVVAAGSLNSLAEVVGDLQAAAGAMTRLMSILDHPARTETCAPHKDPIQGEIQFQDVSFAYPTRPDTPALTHFSCTIRRGETVALVGPSGAGKSTLFALLQRLYDPQQGNVLLDDKPIADYPIATLRQAFAIVPQTPHIFSGTVYDNIAFARPTATATEVLRAAHAAYVHEFAERLPQAYHTVVGERGVQLSGGQRQRIAIARAILKDAPILLLDEATSALDAESEAYIQEALAVIMKNRTSLVIAHRLSTVLSADRIVVMDGGTCVAEGTHDSLMRTTGLYQTYAEKQLLRTAV